MVSDQPTKNSNNITLNGKATARRRQRLSLIGFRGDMFSSLAILEYLFKDNLRDILIVNDYRNITRQSSVGPMIVILLTETGDIVWMPN